jgi:hypothetical protein
MKSQMLGIVLLGVALLAGPARANVINFDNLGNNVTVTNQYANVIFSAGGGEVILTTSQNPPYRGSPPNLICTGTAAVGITPATIDCTQDVILNFTAPVDNLTFNAFGNQTPVAGTFALADVYQLGVLTHANVALLVSHLPDDTCGVVDCNPDPQSLSYLGITQVIIHNNVDRFGTAYDDFSFTPESGPASVPEPSTLLLTGLCGIFWAGRRFLSRKSM